MKKALGFMRGSNLRSIFIDAAKGSACYLSCQSKECAQDNLPQTPDGLQWRKTLGLATTELQCTVGGKPRHGLCEWTC
jgi:hypothetical protein